MKIPDAPKGTRAAGKRLWTSVLAEFELDEHEEVLLREAVRMVDLLEQLHATVERDGVMIRAEDGTALRAHPAAVEARQCCLALARVLAVLRLPSGDEAEGRPQRRAGARGVYGVKSAS